MTDAQAATYHRQYLRWFDQQERMATRMVLGRLRLMSRRVVALLLTKGAGTVSLSIDGLVTDGDETKLLERIYTIIGSLAAEREYDRLRPAGKSMLVMMQTKDRDVPPLPGMGNSGNELLGIKPFSANWRMKMVQLARSSETALRISQITATTKQKVRDVLARGAEQNWNIRKLAKQMQAVIVDKARAILIARTETTRAASAGTEAGAMSTNLLLQKKWIATADARTRDDHLAMLRSAPVARDGFFTVGGLLMKYPGDPAGGAANTCNCRCALAYVPVMNLFDN